MPIYRRALPSEIGRRHVRVVHDLPGREAGRILHGGTCPLRGQVQQGGVRGPFCCAECADPTPPVHVATVFTGLVVEVDEAARTATVWDLLNKRPEVVELPDDPDYPARATVDASPGLMNLHATWQTWRTMEEEQREAKRQKAEAEKAARQKAHEDRIAQAKAEKAARAALAEALRQRQIASAIRRGSRIKVVEDPPGFAERNRKLKPKNREPSLVGTVGFCSESVDPYDTHVFMRTQDGSSVRVLRSTVRVVFSDGSVGEPDLPKQPKNRAG